MLIKEHREAERLSSEAELLLKAGRSTEAVELYRQAAPFEEQALRAIEGAKPRTRGIIAVSAAALYFKAQEYRHTERLIYLLLAEGGLPDFARDQLRELLVAAWEKQAIDETADVAEALATYRRYKNLTSRNMKTAGDMVDESSG